VKNGNVQKYHLAFLVSAWNGAWYIIVLMTSSKDAVH